MLGYIIRRFIYMILLLFLMSTVSFIIIELPPGNVVTSQIEAYMSSGRQVQDGMYESLSRIYFLDKPWYFRYYGWLSGIVHGNFGYSFTFGKPVMALIGERLIITIIISIFTTLFTYVVAIPIGIYSATHQYSAFDYIFSFIGFIGLATPGFLFALILMVFCFNTFGISIGGLFSRAYSAAPWSIGKVLDMLKHFPIPMLVVGLSGTASLIRVTRGMLLDELRKPYVVTARAKGLSETRLLLKYPVRVSLNPIISTIGWLLPGIVSGNTIVSIVLSLPTVGPLLLNALMNEDIYLAGSIIMLLGSLTIVGTFISDLLLVWMDPRIKYER